MLLGAAAASALLLGRVRAERQLREAALASHASQLELLEASRTQLRGRDEGDLGGRPWRRPPSR